MPAQDSNKATCFLPFSALLISGRISETIPEGPCPGRTCPKRVRTAPVCPRSNTGVSLLVAYFVPAQGLFWGKICKTIYFLFSTMKNTFTKQVFYIHLKLKLEQDKNICSIRNKNKHVFFYFKIYRHKFYFYKYNMKYKFSTPVYCADRKDNLLPDASLLIKFFLVKNPF